MTARESPEATTGERPVYRLFVKTRVARRWRSRAAGSLQRLGLRCKIWIEEVRQ
jgi:hypothetical protein